MSNANDSSIRAAFDLGFAAPKGAGPRNPFVKGTCEFKAWQGARNQRKMTADAVRAWAAFTSLMAFWGDSISATVAEQVARGEVVLLQCSA